MAVRTAYDPASGTVLTEGNLEKFAGGWIGYNEVTANQSSLAGGADLTSLAVTVTVNTSRRIKITGNVALQGSVAGDLGRLDIIEGATTLNNGQGRLEASGVGFIAQVVVTPSGGSHTYKLYAIRSAGTGTLTLVASATTPSYILVEDLGPAS